ncbi:hypothetical protein ACO0R3_002705 [Hanseniaspora guilliermondii]
MSFNPISSETLFRVAEEYETKGRDLALNKQLHASATLINQSIVVYTYMVDKHDDPAETNFYLSFDKLMDAYLKLINLLIKYTTNMNLAKKITQRAILKFHESTNEQDDVWYILHMFFYYVIPTKIATANTTEMKQSYSQLDQFLQHSELAPDWKVIFLICQVSFYFKLEDHANMDLSDVFLLLDANIKPFKEQNPDVYTYAQLSKACYYLSRNEFVKMDDVLKANGGEENIEKVIHNEHLLMSFYLFLLYRDIVNGIEASKTISKIHKILTTNKRDFISNSKVFVIKSFKGFIHCECSLLEYSSLKNLLLFFQGISYLDRGSMDLQRDMSEMFFKRIVKNKMTKDTVLLDMVKYYRKWQDEVIFGFEIISDFEEKGQMAFAYAYMELVQMENPQVEDFNNFFQKYEYFINLPQYEDMKMNLKLQLSVLENFNCLNLQPNIEYIDELNGNEDFEDTKTAIKMIYNKKRFERGSNREQNTNVLLQHERFLDCLKKISSKFKKENVSNKNCFLVVIFSILRIDIEDNQNEKFNKYYEIIKGLLINDMKRLFPLKFWVHMIDYTIEMGTKNTESINKIEELKKLSCTLK